MMNIINSKNIILRALSQHPLEIPQTCNGVQHKKNNTHELVLHIFVGAENLNMKNNES
jgi:hypothetical protein